MKGARITSIIIIVVGLLLGWFVTSNSPEGRFSFKLGLDLSGGSQLTYRVDTSAIAPEDIKDATAALRDVIERRVNLFGAVEPRVQTETVILGLETPENRLIVELPGVTDIDEAIKTIGLTPLLEFKLERPEEESKIILDKIKKMQEGGALAEEINEYVSSDSNNDPF